MSRTKKSVKRPGFEYWSKRPISNKHGATPGRETKTRTHRLERLESKKEIQDAILSIQEAAKAGNLEIPHLNKEKSVELGVDGDCTFTISDFDDDCFCFTFADGGGFTGFTFHKKRWPEMRKKIDDFIGAK